MTPQDVLLVHGTWGHGRGWDDFAAELTARGFRVHAPDLPAHGHAKEIDVWQTAEEVTRLGLTDYVDALARVAGTLETPPLIVGHSLGGLLAQLLAARVPHRGVVLLAPAPAAGVFAFYPSMLRLWIRYLPRWVQGRPMFPVGKRTWDRYVCNTTDARTSEEHYADLCAESGRVYREMVLWPLDPKRSSRVDFDKVTGDVLVLAGSADRCCVPAMCRATAARYRGRAEYVELDGVDHMMIAGPHLPATLAAFDAWTAARGITGNGPVAAEATG